MRQWRLFSGVNSWRINMLISLRKHSFASIFLVYLMINLGLNFGETLVSPFAKSLGATPVLVGIVATGFTYGSIMFRLISGPAIDFFNRKVLLLFSVVIIAISFLGEAFSTSVHALIVFRIVQGIGQAFTAPICLTLAAGVISREKIASGIGTLAVARGIATLFAPIVALKFSEATDYKTAFFMATIIEIISIITILNISVNLPKHNNLKRFRISLSGCIAKEAIPPALLQFFFMMAWSCVFAFLVVFGQKQGLGSNVGFFNTAYGIAVFVAAPVGGHLIDRFGYYMLFPMLLLMSISLWMISFSSNLWMLLIAAIVGAFGYGAAGPVTRSMAMSVVSENRRGAASSTLFVASDLGQLFGPIIGGVIISKFGYAIMFRVLPIWVAIAGVLLLFTKQYVQYKTETMSVNIVTEKASEKIEI